MHDKSLNEQFPEDDDFLARKAASGWGSMGDAFGKKTYGDLSPEEWEAEREKMGMKTDDEGNRYLDREYDPGNEPLEIQHIETGLAYFINVEDIEAYVSGEEVIAVDPDRGEDAIRVTREETDVVGVSEEELEDFLVSGDRSADDVDYDVDDDDRFSGMDDVFGADLEEGSCTEQEIAEGTCGYGIDGEIGDEPAGPHLFMLEEELNELKFGCTSNHDCQGGDDNMCCDYNTWSCKPCGDLHSLRPTKKINEFLKGCKGDKDCADEGLCCQKGECVQCITGIDESLVKRFKKLANIKNK